jgi:hypothetical protein
MPCASVLALADQSRRKPEQTLVKIDRLVHGGKSRQRFRQGDGPAGEKTAREALIKANHGRYGSDTEKKPFSVRFPRFPW